jgi:hypothetical protein
MKRLVENPNFPKPGLIRGFVMENLLKMDTNHIATLMHAANKKRVRIDDNTISELLAIWEKKNACAETEKIGNIPTTMIFQGLSYVSRNNDRTLAPRMLTCLLQTITTCPDNFDGQNVGQCLYALRHLR